MGLVFELISGQTPLDEEEREGLLISTITTRQELDEFEQLNIEDAIRWVVGRKFKSEEILTESFIKSIHHRMFGKVWAWAGEFRKSNKNIEQDKFKVQETLYNLLGDCKFWVVNQTYPPDETAIRFKHRLVEIHCFANGNGRHSRLMGDIIVEHIFKQPIFSWGSSFNLNKNNEAREKYLAAIKAADKGDINPLLLFARQ